MPATRRRRTVTAPSRSDGTGRAPRLGGEPMGPRGGAGCATSTPRNGSIPFRRNWAVAESRAEPARDDRTSWQERMGLTVEEALQLPALAGTSIAAGASGIGRVVRHMVV